MPAVQDPVVGRAADDLDEKLLTALYVLLEELLVWPWRGRRRGYRQPDAALGQLFRHEADVRARFLGVPWGRNILELGRRRQRRGQAQRDDLRQRRHGRWARGGGGGG